MDTVTATSPVAPTTPRPTPAAAWGELAGVVTGVARQHWRRFGGDRDEILAQAGVHYCRAVATWNPATGPLRRWVSFFVYSELLDDRRNAAIKHARVGLWREREAARQRAHAGRRWSLPRLLAELGTDAGVALRLLVRCRAGDRGAGPRGVARVVRAHLYDLGWSAVQVARAFAELAEAVR